MPSSDLDVTATEPIPVSLSGLDFADSLLSDLESAITAVLDHSGVHYDNVNARPGGIYVVGWNERQWNPLPDEVAPAVGAARTALTRLREYSTCAARDAPDRLAKLTKIDRSFERLIEQPNGSHPRGAPGATIDDIRELLAERVGEHAAEVRRLPAAHGSGQRLLVPDTSALLDRPDLQEWTLDGSAWTVVFTPQVLAELDERKRDTRTRDCAQKVIRQLEDFDRRGDLTTGVRLAGKLNVRELIRSPDMSQTLPWLRPDTPDDVIIASALELRWDDLTSRIAVAASDRNVRNKARLAGLGVIRTSEL